MRLDVDQTLPRIFWIFLEFILIFLELFYLWVEGSKILLMSSKYFYLDSSWSKISLSHCTLRAPHSYMAEIIWASSLRWVLGHHMHGLLCLLYIHVTWKPCVGVHWGRALLFTVIVALISHRGHSNVNNTMHACTSEQASHRTCFSSTSLFFYNPACFDVHDVFPPVGVRPGLFFLLALDGRRSNTRAPIQTHIYPIQSVHWTVTRKHIQLFWFPAASYKYEVSLLT
jgi:hypothetical protein